MLKKKDSQLFETGCIITMLIAVGLYDCGEDYGGFCVCGKECEVMRLWDFMIMGRTVGFSDCEEDCVGDYMIVGKVVGLCDCGEEYGGLRTSLPMPPHHAVLCSQSLPTLKKNAI